MSDENSTEPEVTAGEVSTESPPESGGRMFTQDDVERIVRERLARTRRDAPRTPVSQDQRQPAPTKSELAVQVEELQERLRFGRAVQGLALDDVQMDKAERLFLSERPTDLAAWKQEIASVFRVNSKEPAPVSRPAEDRAPPVTSAGTSPSGVVTADTPLTAMSPDQRNAVLRELGPTKFRQRMRMESAGVKVIVRGRS